MYGLSLYSLKMNAIYSFRIPHIASHRMQFKSSFAICQRVIILITKNMKNTSIKNNKRRMFC